jgi:xanthine dehydrogenase YagS FAD-binding subunit
MPSRGTSRKSGLRILLFELPDFEYFEPTSIGEAVEILRKWQGSAKVLAGGTDLLGLMKDRINGAQMAIPRALVNIKRIDTLHAMLNGERESVVGACVTLSEIASNAALNDKFPAFTQAAMTVGTTQLRNMGTLGGNLSQRPWCWYFRHPAFDCFKKGGKQCFAIAGDSSTYFSVYDLGVCVMANPSDTAPALISLGASVKIAGPAGEKTVRVEDFFLGPRDVQDNILKTDEIIVNVTIPYVHGQKSVYLKQRSRNNWNFALCSVAAAATFRGSSLASLKVVLGGVAPRPHVVQGVEELLDGGTLTRAASEKIGGLVTDEAKPLRQNKYKVRITKSLVLRALRSVLAKGDLTD